MNTELLHFVIERSTVNIKNSGGFGFIAAGFFKGGQNPLFFCIIDSMGQGFAAVGAVDFQCMGFWNHHALFRKSQFSQFFSVFFI